MLVTFDSLPKFVAIVKDKVKSPAYKAENFTANISFDEAIEKTLHGDASCVSKAEKLIEQLALTIPRTRGFKTIASPYGGRCQFSDWQVGSPTPMRRRIRTLMEYGPVKIVVSTTASYSVMAETMAKRGAAILALLLKLQELRPIELYLLAELGGKKDGWHYQFIRVETKPLDIAIAAFVLCNVGFARHLTYDLARELDGFQGQWPSGYHSSSIADYEAQR